MTYDSGRDWAEAFSAVFDQPESAVQAAVWTEVLGGQYPAVLTPRSLITWSELDRFVTGLSIGHDELLVDVGCGRGGPGLWVAAKTGARYLGVDPEPSEVAAVKARAARLGLAGSADAAVGTFERLPVGTASAGAVMSIDSLLFAPDKSAAARELARVVRPGGRLVFTSWDYHSQPAGRPPQVPDHRPLLEEAGFAVDSYTETPEWERNQRRIDAGLLARVDELAVESGESPEDVRAGLMEMHATLDTMTRRFLMVATRR